MINQVLTLILNFNFNQLRGYILILCYLKILIIRWSIFHSLNTDIEAEITGMNRERVAVGLSPINTQSKSKSYNFKIYEMPEY